MEQLGHGWRCGPEPISPQAKTDPSADMIGHDPALRVDDAVPGDAAPIGQRARDIADESCLARQIGEARYLKVGRYASPRDPRDDCVDAGVGGRGNHDFGQGTYNWDREAGIGEPSVLRNQVFVLRSWHLGLALPGSQPFHRRKRIEPKESNCR